MPSVDEHRKRMARLRTKLPQKVTARIPLDPSLTEEVEAAQMEVQEAMKEIFTADKLGTPKEQALERLQGAQARAQAAEERRKRESIEIEMKSIGRRRVDELTLLHPPTDEEKAEYARMYEGGIAPYNADTYSVALVAHSMAAVFHSPTKEENKWRALAEEFEPQVREWADEWNETEFMTLWTSALAVNTASHLEMVGKAYG